MVFVDCLPNILNKTNVQKKFKIRTCLQTYLHGSSFTMFFIYSQNRWKSTALHKLTI